MFSWNHHQSVIRHCDERCSAPSGFDTIRSTASSSDYDVLCSERRQLECIGGELFRGESLEPT